MDYFKNRKRYAVYEREPQKQGKKNGIILGEYPTKEEAEAARVKYGFISENYYVDEVKRS